MTQIEVELLCVLPDAQFRQRYRLAQGSSVADLWQHSQIEQWLRDHHSTTDLPLGVFGLRVTSQHLLADGDRVEVYRPLQRDPKDVRRRRADRHPVGRRRPRPAGRMG